MGDTAETAIKDVTMETLCDSPECWIKQSVSSYVSYLTVNNCQTSTTGEKQFHNPKFNPLYHKNEAPKR